MTLYDCHIKGDCFEIPNTNCTSVDYYLGKLEIHFDANGQVIINGYDVTKKELVDGS
jgi:hypothetical protein